LLRLPFDLPLLLVSLVFVSLLLVSLFLAPDVAMTILQVRWVNLERETRGRLWLFRLRDVLNSLLPGVRPPYAPVKAGE
jgi:hypothetical protein